MSCSISRQGVPLAALRLDPRTGDELPTEQPVAPPALFDNRPADRITPGRTVAVVDRRNPDDLGLFGTDAFDTASGRRLYSVPPRRMTQDVFSADGRVAAKL